MEVKLWIKKQFSRPIVPFVSPAPLDSGGTQSGSRGDEKAAAKPWDDSLMFNLVCCSPTICCNLFSSFIFRLNNWNVPHLYSAFNRECFGVFFGVFCDEAQLMNAPPRGAGAVTEHNAKVWQKTIFRKQFILAALSSLMRVLTRSGLRWSNGDKTRTICLLILSLKKKKNLQKGFYVLYIKVGAGRTLRPVLYASTA